MRITRLTLIIALSMLMATAAHAQSPREQLSQLIAQLQATPSNDALRQQVIAAAAGLSPAPAVPEDARRYLARGIAAFEIAKSADDFRLALPEFQRAADIAPWWPDAYFNLAKVQEKTGDLHGAIASYRFYVAAAPAADDVESIRTQSYKLEFLAEQKDKEDIARKREDDAKRQRQAWAAAIVLQLQQNWGGRVVGMILNQPPDRFSFDEWNGKRFTYSVCGKDNDRVRIIAPDVITAGGRCGTPTGPEITSLSWCNCEDGTQLNNVKILFGKWTTSGRPAVTFENTEWELQP